MIDFVMFSTKDDFVKSVVNIPKTMLSLVNIYPEKRNRFTNLSFILMLGSVFVLEVAQVMYMKSHSDITELASTCTTVSTNFQAICKLLILQGFRNRISTMLRVCREEFWPVHAVSPQLQASLRWAARLVSLNMAGVLFSGLSFAAVFLFAPLFEHDARQLPFAATLPFRWDVSPVYEIMYCWQVFTNTMYVIVPVCGHDFLFIALMLNTVAQFRLLKYALRSVGNENALSLLRKLTEKEHDGDNETALVKSSPDGRLMQICIQHHITVLKFCDDMESVFSITVFVQYLASISAICVSSFLISLIEKSSVVHLMCFCVGHVVQLFMYCAAGNELMYQSTEVANAAFQSKWYSSDNKQIRRNLILIIQRSQKEKKITALGFIDLNYESFIKVLKLSFSFNALLNSINEK